jgi:hypothetical protein
MRPVNVNKTRIDNESAAELRMRGTNNLFGIPCMTKSKRIMLVLAGINFLIAIACGPLQVASIASGSSRCLGYPKMASRASPTASNESPSPAVEGLGNRQRLMKIRNLDKLKVEDLTDDRILRRLEKRFLSIIWQTYAAK